MTSAIANSTKNFNATIGLYGVMSYAVTQSKRELGLRMALGARRSDLLRIVIGRGLVLTAGGVMLGAIASLSLPHLIGDLLYGVSPHDPPTFVSAVVVMTLAAMAACAVPAWHAMSSDPIIALRHE